MAKRKSSSTRNVKTEHVDSLLPLPADPDDAGAERIRALESELAKAKAELQRSNRQWDKERKLHLKEKKENEALRRKDEQVIAKLRVANDELKLQLSSKKQASTEQRHVAEVIELDDSDDEQPGAVLPTANVKDEPCEQPMPHLATPVSNVASRSATPATANANRQTNTPSRPRRKTTPRSVTRAAIAGLTAEELDDKMSLFLTIKQEDADGKEIESFREVTLSKSRKGDMLWDMDSLGLGPVGEIDNPLYQKAFERKVVSWAFGGGHQNTFHNIDRENAYATFHPKWNPQLPTSPGRHGIAFGYVVSNELFPIFVRVSSNQWRYSGHYSCKMYGELDSTQMARVPRSCLVFIARDYIKKKWGREAIAAENKINMEKAENEGTVYHPILETEDSICAAFLDGRMTMSFTILEYIRFDDSWFQKLLDAEKAGRRIAPKYKTSTKRKRTPSSDMDPPAKKRKGRSGAAVPPEEPVSIVEPVAKEEESDSEVEYIGRTNAPASSGRRLRSATQALSRQMAMDFSTADSDDEEGEEVSDEEDDNDEC